MTRRLSSPRRPGIQVKWLNLQNAGGLRPTLRHDSGRGYQLALSFLLDGTTMFVRRSIRNARPWLIKSRLITSWKSPDSSARPTAALACVTVRRTAVASTSAAIAPPRRDLLWPLASRPRRQKRVAVAQRVNRINRACRTVVRHLGDFRELRLIERGVPCHDAHRGLCQRLWWLQDSVACTNSSCGIDECLAVIIPCASNNFSPFGLRTSPSAFTTPRLRRASKI
jgi:hypothetical protein